MVIALEFNATQRGGAGIILNAKSEVTNSWAKPARLPLDNVWGEVEWRLQNYETEQLVKDSYEESSNLYRGAIQT